MQEIIKKCKFRGAGVVINVPPDLQSAWLESGFRLTFDKKEKSANTLVFAKDSVALLQFLEKGLKKVEEDSVLWIAYPKGTSKVKTDINRDTIRETVETFGLSTVTAVSINDIWSALRFRPIDKVGT
ncbi:DUF3052 family protein [Filimonas effusa]|uniref:DUF3052 family protein n=1 Tax=Filimonas effusa TaxID=2508721 RepID=A0A4Q1DBK5_9BACT|nr:DUF3052 family protein [Filimonas effusa]RXK86822.1 DUF3052 family protein [Filimonas effusa]